jgi:8-oxo-dGTP pyrophosphatase MutT (NUDIX family)
VTHAFPVSVKGVAVQGGRVLLLRNERDEWELPGGKLEVGEDPAACVVPVRPAAIPGLAMPAGYKRSIAAWGARGGR